MCKSRKKLFIFVGVHKTGSSFLHYNLQRLDRPLLKKGCFYNPRGVWYAKTLQSEGNRPDSVLRSTLRNQFNRDIEGANADKILMVSEQFAGHPGNGYADAFRIAEALKEIFSDFDVKIAVSLRQQAEFIFSWYKQTVKQGSALTFEEYIEGLDLQWFDWTRILSVYERFFGRENVRVVNYPNTFANAGTVLDAHFSGWLYDGKLLDWCNAFVNPSIRASALELFRQVNSMVDLDCSRKVREILESHSFDEPFGGTGLILTSGERKLIDVFSAANEKLCRDHGIELSNDDLDLLPRCRDSRSTPTMGGVTLDVELLREISEGFLRQIKASEEVSQQKRKLLDSDLSSTLAEKEALADRLTAVSSDLSSTLAEKEALADRLTAVSSDLSSTLAEKEALADRFTAGSSELSSLRAKADSLEVDLSEERASLLAIRKSHCSMKRAITDALEKIQKMENNAISKVVFPNSLRNLTKILTADFGVSSVGKKRITVNTAAHSKAKVVSNPYHDKKRAEVRRTLSQYTTKEEKDQEWSRIREDVFLQSGELERLERFRGRHQGKRCFIIGNGPSLSEQDLSLMSDEVTFVANWFVNSDRYSEIDPKYYCVSSHEMFGGWNKPNPKLNPDFYERMQNRAKLATKFFSFAFRDYLTQEKLFLGENLNYVLFERPKQLADEVGGLELDLSKHLIDGYTVLLTLCVPMAVHMGCKEIIMVGCDCDYGIKKEGDQKKYFYDSSLHTSSTTSFEGLQRAWVDGGPVFKAYGLARKQLNAMGVSIVNATAGGRLDVLPRVNYESLFYGK